jgi:hypothetical protein
MIVASIHCASDNLRPAVGKFENVFEFADRRGFGFAFRFGAARRMR